MDRVDRPWGYYEILVDESDHKVKRITVLPGHRLSYQLHCKRDEHWTILSGTGEITINGEVLVIQGNVLISISREVKHRLYNNGSSNLVLIEVQTGDYFGEDDIERFEDDYGRV